MNFPAIAVAALVPLVIGALWYNPRVFGTAWLKASKLSEEEARGANMPLVFGLTFLFSLMLSLFLSVTFVHQAAITSLFSSQPEFADGSSRMVELYNELMNDYGHLHRSFGHGVFHGVVTAIFFVLPIVGVLALFERKGGRYIFVHAGYWAVSLAVMGGIICAWI